MFVKRNHVGSGRAEMSTQNEELGYWVLKFGNTAVKTISHKLIRTSYVKMPHAQWRGTVAG